MIQYRGLRVTLSGPGDVGYTPSVPMWGYNSCGCSLVMLQLTGSSPDVNITVQVSMDQENWSEPSVGPAGSQEVEEVGAAPLLPFTPLIARYIRLKVTLVKGDLGIVSVDLNTFNS